MLLLYFDFFLCVYFSFLNAFSIFLENTETFCITGTRPYFHCLNMMLSVAPSPATLLSHVAVIHHSNKAVSTERQVIGQWLVTTCGTYFFFFFG